MKVILAGYSKTGTKTMATAFRMLGYNTYDAMENYYYAHKVWVRIFKGKATLDEIQEAFADVDAMTDTPAHYYWEKLHEAFPDAKIILTLREEDSWYKSLIKWINLLNRNWFIQVVLLFAPAAWTRLKYQDHINSFVGHFVRFPKMKIVPMNEKILREHYRYHNANILQKAPKDKLLVYNVSEGWKPLCEFLGVEIPDKPFPHKNKGGDILQDMAKSDNVASILVKQSAISLAIFTGIMAFGGYKFFTSDAWSIFSRNVSRCITDTWKQI
uniref:Uncharacterized protein LOC100187240 n=1 Tax=Phallusia mammillata TaxID=59560 RepID=A0A6F9DIU1_9ASCI|nr:uncharacterized protein LOC100187240 [Phallusia mammillata]